MMDVEERSLKCRCRFTLKMRKVKYNSNSFRSIKILMKRGYGNKWETLVAKRLN